MTILAKSGITFFEHEKKWCHSLCAFLLYSGTVCVHFYSFQTLSVCISIISQHFSPCAFLLCSALSACISTTLQHSLHAFLLCLYVFVCVCLYAFVCVVLYVFVCVCMCLYVFVCVLLCLYVFVCVCMCFVCVCIFYVLMFLYVFVCVCVCVWDPSTLFFYEHFYCVPALLPESTRSARLHDSAENLCWEGNLCLRFDINRALVILMEEHFTMSRVGMTL